VPPAQQSESAAISPSTDQDSVALIGAALASPGARSAVGAQQAAASDPSLKEAEETPYEATTTAIHVVAQQTWLPPVSPAFSPGLSRQAAADHAAPETSQAASGKTKDLAGDKEAAAIETKSSVPTADSAPEKAPQTPFASVLSSGGGKFEPGRGEAPKPAATAAPTPTASSDAPPTILAATPRKDLEITLAPKELGGLEVRMKSAGDRLELAFVADRGETARMISDKSAALASQLHGAGLGQGGIDISSTASGQGGGGEGPPGGGRSPHPSSGEQPARRQESQGRDRQDRNNETNKQTGDAPSRGQRGLYL
jgi:flagellar hook-length control protein FliK